MNFYYNKFCNLSDENLLRRLERKENYQKEAIEAVYQILVERGYNVEYPFSEEQAKQLELEKKTYSFRKRWTAIEHHLVFKKFFSRISLTRLSIFGLFFTLSLIVSNLGVVDSIIYRKIHVFSDTILGLGSISYLVFLSIIYFFFFFRNNTLNNLISFDSNKFRIGVKTFILLLVIISIWELMFSDYFTLYGMFENKSYRMFLKEFWFGIFVAFTEEFIFKWILLVQVLIRIPETRNARVTAFIIIGILFALAHIPIQLSKYESIQYIHLITTFLFSYFSSVLFVRTRNFPLVVFLHFLMNISYILVEGGSSFYFFWCLIIIGIYSQSSISESKLFQIKKRNFGPKWIFSIPFVASILIVFFIPKQGLDYYNISSSLYKINKDEKALFAINKALKISKDKDKFYNLKGSILYDYEEYDSAYYFYSKSIEINSNYNAAIRNRGLTCKFLKRYDQGIKDLSKALDKGLKSARIYQHRGTCFIGLKEYENGLLDLHKSLEIEPDNSTTLFQISRAFLYMEEYDSSILYQEMVINRSPESIGAYELMAVAYTSLERYDTSNYIMTRAIEMGSTSPIRFYIRGVNYYKKEQYSLALSEFEKAYEHEQVDDDVNAYLGYSYIFTDDYINGCEFLRVAAELGDEEALLSLEEYCK